MSYPSAHSTARTERKAPFLWDYIAHGPEGILLAAESEFEQSTAGLQHDFEKLLYVRSPLKLVMTRVRSQQEALVQVQALRNYMDSCSQQYSPSEIFIIYCVWWAEEDGVNRDFAYLMQIPGEPSHCSADGAKFEAV